eukprot:jgi/Botrbrau1/4135/Bobra.0192s0009.1
MSAESFGGPPPSVIPGRRALKSHGVDAPPLSGLTSCLAVRPNSDWVAVLAEPSTLIIARLGIAVAAAAGRSKPNAEDHVPQKGTSPEGPLRTSPADSHGRTAASPCTASEAVPSCQPASVDAGLHLTSEGTSADAGIQSMPYLGTRTGEYVTSPKGACLGSPPAHPLGSAAVGSGLPGAASSGGSSSGSNLGGPGSPAEGLDERPGQAVLGAACLGLRGDAGTAARGSSPMCKDVQSSTLPARAGAEGEAMQAPNSPIPHTRLGLGRTAPGGVVGACTAEGSRKASSHIFNELAEEAEEDQSSPGAPADEDRHTDDKFEAPACPLTSLSPPGGEEECRPVISSGSGNVEGSPVSSLRGPADGGTGLEAGVRGAVDLLLECEVIEGFQDTTSVTDVGAHATMAAQGPREDADVSLGDNKGAEGSSVAAKVGCGIGEEGSVAVSEDGSRRNPSRGSDWRSLEMVAQKRDVCEDFQILQRFELPHVSCCAWVPDGTGLVVGFRGSASIFQVVEDCLVVKQSFTLTFWPKAAALGFPAAVQTPEKAFYLYFTSSAGVVVYCLQFRGPRTAPNYRPTARRDHKEWAVTQVAVLEVSWQFCELAVSPDSRFLASATLSGQLWIWDVVQNFSVLAQEHIPFERVTSMAFSPDSDELAVACWDGAILVYKPAQLMKRYNACGPCGVPCRGSQDPSPAKHSAGLNAVLVAPTSGIGTPEQASVNSPGLVPRVPAAPPAISRPVPQLQGPSKALQDHVVPPRALDSMLSTSLSHSEHPPSGLSVVGGGAQTKSEDGAGSNPGADGGLPPIFSPDPVSVSVESDSVPCCGGSVASLGNLKTSIVDSSQTHAKWTPHAGEFPASVGCSTTRPQKALSAPLTGDLSASVLEESSSADPSSPNFGSCASRCASRVHEYTSAGVGPCDFPDREANLPTEARSPQDGSSFYSCQPSASSGTLGAPSCTPRKGLLRAEQCSASSGIISPDLIRTSSQHCTVTSAAPEVGINSSTVEAALLKHAGSMPGDSPATPGHFLGTFCAAQSDPRSPDVRLPSASSRPHGPTLEAEPLSQKQTGAVNAALTTGSSKLRSAPAIIASGRGKGHPELDLHITSSTDGGGACMGDAGASGGSFGGMAALTDISSRQTDESPDAGSCAGSPERVHRGCAATVAVAEEGSMMVSPQAVAGQERRVRFGIDMQGIVSPASGSPISDTSVGSNDPPGVTSVENTPEKDVGVTPVKRKKKKKKKKSGQGLEGDVAVDADATGTVSVGSSDPQGNALRDLLRKGAPSHLWIDLKVPALPMFPLLECVKMMMRVLALSV